jgi:hypothetical protein
MKIILGTFKDNAQDLADFLGPRLGDVPAVSSDELTFDDEKMKKTIRSRHVKTYIKRYLNRKGERDNYQILVEGRELRMIELEQEEEEEEEKEDKKRAQKAEIKKKEEEEEKTEKAPELPPPAPETKESQDQEEPNSDESKGAAPEEDASDSTSS